MSVSIPIQGPLKGARYIDRPNRFTIRVALEPEETVVEAHLGDPGYHAALLASDQRLWVRATPHDGRRTDWAAVLVQSRSGALVSLDPELPSALARAAVEDERIPELRGWHVERPDAPVGRTRVAFQLRTEAGEQMMLAVLNATRVEHKSALYPDGASEYACRHVAELAEVPKRPGWHATALFVVQRNDADEVVANTAEDPDFAAALHEAEAAGVRILGRRCQLTLEEAMLGVSIPVRIS